MRDTRVLNISHQAVYSSLLQLTWIDELLDTVKKLFVALYGDQLKKPHTSTIECHFDDYFESRVRELEKKAGGPARVPTPNVVDGLIEKGDGWAGAPPIPGMMKGVPTNALCPCRNGDLLFGYTQLHRNQVPQHLL